MENGILKYLDKGIERPVLIINFKSSYYDNVLQNSIPIKDAYFIVISMKGEIIYNQKPENIITGSKAEWLMDITQNKTGTMQLIIDGKHMIACYDTSKLTDWITIALIPTDNLMTDLLPVIKTYTIYLTFVLLCISLICAFIISGRIAKPVKKLLSAFKRTGAGDFNYKISEESKGEFSYLIQKFNTMNDKIQLLIEENFESKIREKESQIMALNLQLNPHFLYNTLNIINWMAIENKQDEISRMIINLSVMLQYTIKNTSETVTLEEDLEWLRGYVYIMSMRFEGKFSVEYNIAPDLNKCIVPKLFLQPFVENSIIHGFEEKEHGGILKITGFLVDNCCCFHIEDNGKGMSTEKISQIMDGIPGTTTIGIRNVDSRIKLIYGTEYGVSITSEINEGTKVFINFPVKLYTPKNNPPLQK